jgi:sugar O-acyltransferase (sialic acid O-acetyltransferase NeuD family)
MKKPLIIWGASGHSKVLREFIYQLGFDLIALFDNAVVPVPFPNVPLFLGREGFLRWKVETCITRVAGLVAIGGDKGHERLAIQAFLRENNTEIINAVHPTAFVAADASLGEGCQVLAQSVIGVEARIGDGCIINTKASVDHECVLGDGVHIAPGATLAGCVEVGNCVMIGAGTVVLPRVRIGYNAIVGAGSIVTKDVPDNAVVVGNPARFLRWQTES